MVDCELTFKCGEYNFFKCLEKSFLYNDDFPKVFESRNITETKDYLKKILINSINIQRNIGSEEFNLICELINYLIYLETKKLTTIDMYCEIALR